MAIKPHPVLGKLGWFGTALLNLGVLLTTPWAVAVSVAVGMLAALVGWITNLLNNPAIHASVFAGVVTFWTYIGLIIVADRRKPRVVKAHQDYAYGLTFEACAPNYSPDNPIGALQFNIQVRNFSNGPLRITLEKFEVIIGNRIVPQTKRVVPTCFVPRGGARVLRSLPFKMEDIKEFFDKHVQGTAEFVLIYGHPDEPPVRRLRMKLEIYLELKTIPPMGYADGILEESDEPIIAA